MFLYDGNNRLGEFDNFAHHLNQAGLQTMEGRHWRRRFQAAFHRAASRVNRLHYLQLSGRQLGFYGDKRRARRQQSGRNVSVVLFQAQKQKKGRRLISRLTLIYLCVFAGQENFLQRRKG